MRASTDRREFFDGCEHEFPFIVPSAMTAVEGMTAESNSHPYARTLSYAGPWQHLVIEHDFGTRDAQAAILLHLSQYARIRMVVYSGGKSLHGWFGVHGWSEGDIFNFHCCAARLGADTHTFTRVHLVCTPNAMRDATRKQEVQYLEAAPDTRQSETPAPTTTTPGQTGLRFMDANYTAPANDQTQAAGPSAPLQPLPDFDPATGKLRPLEGCLLHRRAVRSA